MRKTMKPGDKVIIRLNPHHPGSDGIVGTVMVYHPGEGFNECDLVDVHYKNPKDGKGYTMPFGLACLDSADEASLIALAEHYKTLAAQIREVTHPKRNK
jgi:hypothetical protein